MSGDIEILVDRVLTWNVAGSSLESVRKFLAVQFVLSVAGGSWKWAEWDNNCNTENNADFREANVQNLDR